MPYADWVASHQTEADEAKTAAFAKAFAENVGPPHSQGGCQPTDATTVRARPQAREANCCRLGREMVGWHPPYPA